MLQPLTNKEINSEPNFFNERENIIQRQYKAFSKEFVFMYNFSISIVDNNLETTNFYYFGKRWNKLL